MLPFEAIKKKKSLTAALTSATLGISDTARHFLTAEKNMQTIQFLMLQSCHFFSKMSILTQTFLQIHKPTFDTLYSTA